jgi:ATP-dependent Clp protease adaptor protein ClpS
MGLVIRNENDEQRDSGVLVERRVRAERPSLYKVMLLNDDFTPMDFVIEVLESVFGQDHTAATKIMLDVHRKGSGVCGVYPFEIAETKVARVQKMSKDSGHPLQCVLEKA